MGTDTILPGHPKAGPAPDPKLEAATRYGTVVRTSPTEVVVALRGTDGYMEWFEDADFPFVDYQPLTAVAGGTAGVKVERGFWGIYQSFTLFDPTGKSLGSLPVALPGLVGPNDSVVVSGHSLGAPLATYLTLDLALGTLKGRVRGCYFASPHPGNAAFAALFESILSSNYIVYNYMLDLVPGVPTTGIGYRPLNNVHIITPDTAQAEIDLGVGCSHHIVCYLSMLDYAQTMAALNPVPHEEASSYVCILGPLTGQSTLAKLLVGRVVQLAQKL
jgi:hypothetical protein